MAQTPKNRPPTIITLPRTTAVTGEVYVYQALADDPEKHTVRWELQQAPEGMTIDEDSGLVLWAPTTSDLGDHSVVVKAIDVYSASSTQP